MKHPKCPSCKREHPAGAYKEQETGSSVRIRRPDDIHCPCGALLRYTVPVFTTPHGYVWRLAPSAIVTVRVRNGAIEFLRDSVHCVYSTQPFGSLLKDGDKVLAAYDPCDLTWQIRVMSQSGQFLGTLQIAHRVPHVTSKAMLESTFNRLHS